MSVQPTIESVETGLYGIPTEEALEDATQTFDELELVVVEVRTSTGGTGVGFTYTIGEGGGSIKRFVDDVLGPKIEGRPIAPRRVRDELRARTTFVGREGVSELALSAVDIALWEAKGRELGAPLYELLGGDRTPVPAYETNGGWLHLDIDTLRKNARAAAENGFAGMKMKVGRGHHEDAKRIRAVREELPHHVDLMVDANCAFSVAEARRFASHVDPSALTWLEEPLEKGDYSAYAKLRSAVDVPIAVGENYYNETQFKQVLSADAADFLQPDVGRVGGITPWVEIANAGGVWNVPVSPHYLEPVHVHLAAPFDNVPYIEHHSTVLDEVLKSPLDLSDGAFVPPSEPGLGIRFEGLDRYEKSPE